MKLASLGSLALICSAASADESASTGKVTAEFIGASGGLKIFPKSDANGFIMVQQSKLQEVDANGVAPGGTSISMAGQNTWTALATTQTEGKTVYSTTFSKTSGATSFELTAHLARETTTTIENVPCNNCTSATSGGCQNAALACEAATDAACTGDGYSLCTETVAVVADELKFSIVVQGFPFKDPANKLQYMLEIKDKTGAAGTVDAKDAPGAAKSKTVAMNGGHIDTPTTAVIKGGAADETVDVVVTATEQGSKRQITFLFDSFAAGKALYYDPTLIVETSGASAVAAASLFSVAALGLLTASVALY